MRKRLLSIVAIGLAAMLSLSGCAPIVEDAPQNLSIYATFYPIYALAGMVLQDVPGIELHCLVQPQDGCLRSYELSDWDIYLLGYSADAILAAGNGLEGDSDTLQKMAESSVPLVEVMYGMELYLNDRAEADEDSHFSGENPHVYLSIDGGIDIVQRIAASMDVLSAENADLFNQNADQAQEKLEALKQQMQTETADCHGVKAAILNETLFYVAQDCGLEIAAWFERESGTMLYGTTMEECLERLRVSGAQLALIEQQAPTALETALEDAGYAVARLDTLSTRSETEDGIEGYLDAMMENAKAVAEACRRILE